MIASDINVAIYADASLNHLGILLVELVLVCLSSIIELASLLRRHVHIGWADNDNSKIYA